MSATRRTRTPSLDMEAALLDAAAELLEQAGPESLSVRRIATAAGVAPMGVYNHFESKFGIIEALFIQGFARLADAMATLNEIDDPYEALHEAGQRYRALALAYPMMYQVMFFRAVPGFEPSEWALETAANAFDGLATLVQRAMADGIIADGPPADTAQVIWSAIHGWVSLELCGIGFVEDQAAGFSTLCAAVVAGLRPE